MVAISYARPCPVVVTGAVSAGRQGRLAQVSFRGMTPAEPPGASITLSSDEALVLFDWLERIIQSNDLERLVPDPPEWFALLRLSGVLESTLVEPFDRRYGELIEAAQGRLRKLAVPAEPEK
jgi:hypothetical protein